MRYPVGALQQAVDAGIPVVTIDRRVEGVPGILSHVRCVAGQQPKNVDQLKGVRMARV